MKTKHQTKIRTFARLILGVGGLSLTTFAAAGANSFLGVAAGDASSADATLWTRCLDTNAPAVVSLTAQVSTDPAFGLHTDFSVSTDTAKEYTAKVVATSLTAGTKYYYRFTDGSVTSGVGTFKTAPTPSLAAPVSFAFSGDCDGLIRPYALASQLPNKNLDFFMFDGDTEYETSASIGSPAVTSTASATKAQLFTDFSRKYREQFIPVNVSGQACLKDFFAGQGNYTTYDNHELGNKQYISGGAPAGAAISTDPVNLPTGTGFAGKVSENVDTNFSALGSGYMNKSAGFQTLQQVFMNYQPIKERGLITAPADPRTDSTRQLYFSQQWGKNVLFINTDCRTYRDIRLKLSDGSTDDTGSRADNTNRTMLGVTQLAWLEQTLLAAESNGIPWKFINISDPIDQIGPIGGVLATNGLPTQAEYGTLGNVSSIATTASSGTTTMTVASAVGLIVGQPVSGAGIAPGSKIASIGTGGTTFTLSLTPTSTVAGGTVLTLSPAASTYVPVNADGGKSWIGGYRAERNALLKFIADNHIRNVVFLATDDHQNRINELTYSPTSDTANQSSYVKVPYCFEVVCGPLGATGPDLIQNHTFALAKKLADSLATNEIAAGVEPIGLGGYPGLHDIVREGDALANIAPQPVDFYSPDTFNYNKFDVSADGKTLTITSYGINSTLQNGFTEYDSINNAERQIFSFKIDAASDLAAVDHIIVIYQENWSFDALYGNFPGANGIANASSISMNQLDRLTGSPLGSLPAINGFNRYTGSGNETVGNTVKSPGYLNIPPQPIRYNLSDGSTGFIDTNFLSNPADATSAMLANSLLPYDVSPYVPANAQSGDIVHKYWQELFQINGGSNNMFVTWSDNPGLVMSHFDATQMPEGKLAQQYVMCDNLYHSAFGGSFLNHQWIIAAKTPVYWNMPVANNSAIALLDGNGVFAPNASGINVGKAIRDGSITPLVGDVLPGLTINDVTNQSVTVGSSGFGSDICSQNGSHFDKHYVVNTTFTANMCPTFSVFGSVGLMPAINNTNALTSDYSPNIGDRLDAAGINWKWYSGGWNAALESSKSNPLHPGTVGSNTVSSLFQWHHQAFAYFAKSAPFASTNVYADGRNPYATAHLQDENNFFTDVTNNTLPSVVFIKPLGPDNEHPGYASLLQGQLHVSNIVAAVQANPALWAHTAIIVTYDEHGGRWDHVAPPTRDIWGPGVRVPGIIISPLAKTNYVDHTQYETLSILKTIEQRFGVAPLTAADAAANSFAPAFNTTLASIAEPTTPPTISVVKSGSNFTLNWPANYTSYVLQSTTNILTVWSTISTGSSNTFNLTVDPSQSSQFFRLLRP